MTRFSTSPIRQYHPRADELGDARRGVAWSDAALVGSMRRGDQIALRAFVDRFRPVLEAHARKTHIPRSEWASCVTELLDDEAMRLAASGSPPPANLSAYLMRAATNRHLHAKRAGSSRDRHYRSAAEDFRGEIVVPSSCSAFSIRAALGPSASSLHGSPPVRQLAIALRHDLSHEDDTVMSWLAEGVPNRRIAEWLGITQAAAAKRTWRLRNRLRKRALAWIALQDADDRRQLERLVSRADVETGPSTRGLHRRLEQ